MFFFFHSRQMIINGCAAFAQVVEASRVEAELLPQLWEQVLIKTEIKLIEIKIIMCSFELCEVIIDNTVLTLQIIR